MVSRRERSTHESDQRFQSVHFAGNVVDLDVGIVIGVAFGAVVLAFVKDFITPLIAAFGGMPDFSGLYFTINHSKFLYGDFVNALLAFLLIAAIVFFVVRPVNRLMARAKGDATEADATDRQCPYCLSSVPKAATRCAYCTSQLEPVTPTGAPPTSPTARP
jgi:large conductance mechanosensitive channel